jgi:glutathione S-transferase
VPRVVRLYRIPFSTNVERVALALAYKGLDAEPVEVDPADRSPVVSASGQELVPVLDADGRIVSDSTLILEYLEERYPDPPLYPRDPARRAECVVFVDWFNRVWKVAPNAIEAELSRVNPDRARIATLGAEMARSLDLFESLLAGGDFLLGEFTAADCAAFPFLKYALLHDPEDEETFHRILVENLPLGVGHPRLAAWIRRMDARPRVPPA